MPILFAKIRITENENGDTEFRFYTEIEHDDDYFDPDLDGPGVKVYTKESLSKEVAILDFGLPPVPMMEDDPDDTPEPEETPEEPRQEGK